MNKPLAKLAFAAAGLLAVGAALTGCAVVDELAYKRQSATYDTVAALKSSGLEAAWIPADATHIEVTRTTIPEATDATLLLQSDTALDPDACVEVSRQSAPVYALEGAPNALEAETVYACGEWSVMPADDGWLGWTPNHPDEADQSESRP